MEANFDISPEKFGSLLQSVIMNLINLHWSSIKEFSCQKVSILTQNKVKFFNTVNEIDIILHLNIIHTLEDSCENQCNLS